VTDQDINKSDLPEGVRDREKKRIELSAHLEMPGAQKRGGESGLVRRFDPPAPDRRKRLAAGR